MEVVPLTTNYREINQEHETPVEIDRTNRKEHKKVKNYKPQPQLILAAHTSLPLPLTCRSREKNTAQTLQIKVAFHVGIA